ncbi:MAG: substrate-binding domain-containing protein [Acidimicrobiales bacterium]|jgi:D-xylose transport system substrate-binding protein
MDTQGEKMISNKVRRIATSAIALVLMGTMGVAVGATSASSATKVKTISVADINSSYSAMKLLKPITAEGKGGITVILPDEVSSNRWVDFDAPDLKKALLDAGMKASQITIENSQGNDATAISMAQAAILKGDKVIIYCALDSATGATIEADAHKAGVKVIDYDRLVLGGSDRYYVSFNNVTVGTLLGNGLVSCISAWKITSPKVIVGVGSPTDNNATLFADGYDAVLNPLFTAGTYKLEATLAGTWTPSQALTEFQQAYTANPTTNALLSPNDENAAPIITYLQTLGVKPYTFPVTGQDATATGLQNIVAGYQCGTVYKPVPLEAQGAVALAMYARANKKVPASLDNSKTLDSTSGKEVPSLLLPPQWVTASTIEKTVVADGFVPASQICTTAALQADCTTYGIH